MHKQKNSCLTPLNLLPFDFLFQDLVHPAQKLSNPNVFVGKLPLQPKDVLTKIGLVANPVRKNYHVVSISAQFHVMKEMFVHPVTRKVFNWWVMKFLTCGCKISYILLLKRISMKKIFVICKLTYKNRV